MKKNILLSLFSFLFLTTSFVYAEGDLESKAEIIESVFEARFEMPAYIQQNKALLFDATPSKFLNNGERVDYFWQFAIDAKEQKKKQIIHTFSETGKQKILLTVRQGENESVLEKEVFVYSKQMTLIADDANKDYENIIKRAGENGDWLHVIHLNTQGNSIRKQERFLQSFHGNYEFFKSSHQIVFYVQDFESTASFVRFYNNLPQDKAFSLKDKNIFILSDGDFSRSTGVINNMRKSLGIEEIFMMRFSSLQSFFEAESRENFLQILEERGQEYFLVNDDLRPSRILFLSRMISSFLSAGIPQSTIYLLLSFPFIAFLVAFNRQFVGITTFGAYLPIMIALSFFILGLGLTLFVASLVVSISVGLRFFFARIDLLFIPRSALTLSIMALSFFFVIWVAVKFQVSVVIPLAIFPMLVISTMSEKFIAAHLHEGFKVAFMYMLGTIITSFIAYFILSLHMVSAFILSYPEVIFLPLFGIFLLGRFSGLRITEYFRFWDLLSDTGAEE